MKDIAVVHLPESLSGKASVALERVLRSEANMTSVVVVGEPNEPTSTTALTSLGRPNPTPYVLSSFSAEMLYRPPFDDSKPFSGHRNGKLNKPNRNKNRASRKARKQTRR